MAGDKPVLTRGKEKARQAAEKAKKAVAKGTRETQKRKIRTSATFHRPTTLRLARKPRYSRKSAPAPTKMDPYSIIKFPLTTEPAMRKIEENNTLVFVCDVRANKRQIEAAANTLYNIKAARINTLVRPDGTKKAYIRLDKGTEALAVANTIGII
eukprot:Clim_evm31s9 gene=Clim_evmTU31s9